MNQKRLPVFFSTLILSFSIVLAACDPAAVREASAETKTDSGQIEIARSERLLLYEAMLDQKYGSAQVAVAVIQHVDKSEHLLLHEAMLDQKYGTTQVPVALNQTSEWTDGLPIRQVARRGHKHGR